MDERTRQKIQSFPGKAEEPSKIDALGYFNGTSLEKNWSQLWQILRFSSLQESY
jgi:hypothetical protein